MSFALRIVLLFFFAGVGFLGYGHALGYLSNVMITNDNSLIYGTMLMQGFIAAALVAALLCFPLAKVFRRHAPYAALVVSLPVLLLRIPELMDSSRHPFALFISAYEVLAYALLLVLGAWLAHKQIIPNTALQRDAPHAARP
jgi:uncharacterized membrane protein